MKRVFVSLIFLLLIFPALYAQDKIITRNSETIEAIVLEVGIDDVKYRRSDNPTGPIYTLLKSDIASIVYANGKAEVFDDSRDNEKKRIQQDNMSTQGELIGMIGNGGCYFDSDNPLIIHKLNNQITYGNYVINESTMQLIVNSVDANLGKELQAARKLENSGITVVAIGGTLFCAGGLFVGLRNLDDALFAIGASVGALGLVIALPIGVPIWSVADKRINNIIDRYNTNVSSSVYSKNSPVELRLISNQKGIGLAIAF